MIVDLDANNAIISIEKHQPDAQFITKLKELHNEGKLILRLSGIGASEFAQDPTGEKRFQDFQKRLEMTGLSGCEILKPLWRLGLTFLGHCILAGEELIALDAAVHKILHPKIPFEYVDFCEQRNIDPNVGIHKTWLNAICDTQSFWCHVYHQGDVFVSSDANFKKKTKLPKLIAIGAKYICTPSEVLSLVSK